MRHVLAILVLSVLVALTAEVEAGGMYGGTGVIRGPSMSYGAGGGSVGLAPVYDSGTGIVSYAAIGGQDPSFRLTPFMGGRTQYSEYNDFCQEALRRASSAPSFPDLWLTHSKTTWLRP